MSFKNIDTSMNKLLSNNVLFVDDDHDDLEFYGAVLQEVNKELVIHEAHSGTEALEYLNHSKNNGGLPCLIILDMNMPILSGIDTIKEIKKDKDYDHIPIVVFSTAREMKEGDELEKLGVACFVKPNSYEEMKKLAGQFICSI